MGPFVDDTRPTVLSVVARDELLVAETHDETPLAVPAPGSTSPVMPAPGPLAPARRPRPRQNRVETAADFRLDPPASEFDDRWAPGTTQNHVRAPGRYKVVLAHSLDVRAGRYQVEVAVRDTRGNGSVHRFPLDLSGS